MSKIVEQAATIYGFHLQTALNVSGVNYTHHQALISLYLQFLALL
jgi:hypothetical protein